MTQDERDVDADLPLEVPMIRQWISLGKGSCDVRVGTGMLDKVSDVMRTGIGRPRGAALAYQAGVSADLLEYVRTELTDVGFLVSLVELPAEGSARTLEAAGRLAAALAAAGITADDAVVALGRTDALSLCSYVCDSWCGGTPLAAIPLDLGSALACVTPLGLDVDGRPELVAVKGHTRYAFVDLSSVSLDQQTEPARLARAAMATTAIAESEKAFSALWDQANAITVGEPDAVAHGIVDCLRERGHMMASTTISIRQVATYGSTFVRALRGVAPAGTPDSTLLAEALRFTARIACGKGEFAVDDVLACDELLDRLQLPQLRGHVDPDRMLEALHSDRFSRSGRFLLGLPRALGRVRMATVDDDLLAEHVKAFCATREA